MPSFSLKFTPKIPFFATIFFQIFWVLINSSFNWQILGFWSQEKLLGRDLWFVASSVDCDRRKSFLSASISPECENYYGVIFIRLLRMFGFGLNNYFAVYLIMTAATVVITSWLFARHSTNFSRINKVFWFFILFGPPYLLLLHRGNIDQIIFDLLAFSFYRSRKSKSIGFFVILVFCTLIKFYCFPLLFMYILIHDKRNLYFWTASLMVAAELAREYFMLELRTLENISSSFGIAIFKDYYLKFHPQYDLVLYFLIPILIVSTLIILFFSSRKKFRDLSTYLVASVPPFGLWIVLIHLFCFLVFINYDWRLIYLLFFLFLIVQIPKRINHKGLIFLSASISWFSSGFNQVAVLGDLLLYFLFLFFVATFMSILVSKRFKFLRVKN